MRRRHFSGSLRQQSGRSFTLIELLVVIAIIAILAAMLMPSLAMARDKARRLVCLTGVRSLGVASTAYANDNNRMFAQTGSGPWESGGAAVVLYFWKVSVADQLRNQYLGGELETVKCPTMALTENQWTAGHSSYSGVYRRAGYISTATSVVDPARPDHRVTIDQDGDGAQDNLRPYRLSDADPSRMLFADFVMTVDGVNWNWTAGVHLGSDGIPVGGNQVCVDGSAVWRQRADMLNMYSYWGSLNDGDRDFFW